MNCMISFFGKLKMNYRREMVRKNIECFYNKCEFSMALLDAMRHLRSAWRRVKQSLLFLMKDLKDQKKLSKKSKMNKQFH